MNNNIELKNKEISNQCLSILKDIKYSKQEQNKLLIKLLQSRPVSLMRISDQALNICLENKIIPFDCWLIFFTPNGINKMAKKYGEEYKNFFRFKSEQATNNNYIIIDYNISIEKLVKEICNLYFNNTSCTAKNILDLLNQQSLDLISPEENMHLLVADLKKDGTRQQRDALCSKKLEFKDLWLTPQDVITQFFNITKLNKNNCLDPCASDARWLGNEGMSIDILPMVSNVIKKDFLTMTKQDLPNNITTIVGNLPFSLLDDFVNKALELTGDCYFLVNGDTILEHFPDNIEHLYIFNGLEGNQADHRSRSEFDVPYLIKSSLWCCIVHITKDKQEKFILEKNLTNNEKRDGYHIALGKNSFIKSDSLVTLNPRISIINVTGTISYKGGKKIYTDDGIIDLKTLDYLQLIDMTK